MNTTTTAATDLLAAFPFPFVEDRYRYSTNVEPARRAVATPAGQWGDTVIAIDGEYHRELQERADILAVDPGRHAVLPHMRPAAWDAMLTVMRELAAAYPATMRLTRTVAGWRWENLLLGISQDFVYGDESTLPEEPLRYLAGQVQEDIVLLDQREQLYGDAGVVTFAADWSFGFDVGMSFLEIHGPVPRVRQEGVINRAHEFLKRLQPHQPYRRTNWTMTVGRRLDVSTELYPEWGPDRELIQQVDDEAFGLLVHLRVEVQHLIRLPNSGAIMFLIRTYLLPLEELAGVESWRVRTAAVLAELPADLAEYKGIIKYKDRAAAWLMAQGVRPPAPRTVETVHPPALSLPDWPSTPAEVDLTGTSFLVVAVGEDPQTSVVARDWIATAETVGPTTLAVLDSADHAEDRAVLDRLLTRARTGIRLMVVGGQYDVLRVLTAALDAGAVPGELRPFVVHTRDLPLYCAHCRDTFRVDAGPGEEIACPGCARTLEIHAHHSAALGSFLASDAQARELR